MDYFLTSCEDWEDNPGELHRQAIHILANSTSLLDISKAMELQILAASKATNSQYKSILYFNAASIAFWDLVKPELAIELLDVAVDCGPLGYVADEILNAYEQIAKYKDEQHTWSLSEMLRARKGPNYGK